MQYEYSYSIPVVRSIRSVTADVRVRSEDAGVGDMESALRLGRLSASGVILHTECFAAAEVRPDEEVVGYVEVVAVVTLCRVSAVHVQYEQYEYSRSAVGAQSINSTCFAPPYMRTFESSTMNREPSS